MRKHFIRGRVIACDTETTGLSAWHGDQPYMFTFCNKQGETACIEFAVDPKTRRVKYEEKPAELTKLRRLFSDRSLTISFFNAKHDVRMIEVGAGLPFKCKMEEVSFAAHACNSGEMKLALKTLAAKYADYPNDDEKALKAAVNKLRRAARKLGWKLHKDTEADYWLCQYAEKLGHPELAKLCEIYGVCDAERTMLLRLFYWPKMKELGVYKAYRREMQLWPVVYRMEARGVCVDPVETKKLRQAFKQDADRHGDVLQKYGRKALKAGVFKDNVKEFNPDSNPQLGALLYDYCGLVPPRGRVKKGKSRPAKPTDSDTLLELSASHVLPDAILKHRAAVKGMQFVESYEQRMIREDAVRKIHADFNQVGPRTGRFSCRTPNLQQVPSKSTGRAANPIDCRSPFGPAPGHIWYCLDYSQLEVRIFADRAQETQMLKLINSGTHIHKACANHVWGGLGDVAVRNARRSLGLGREEEHADSEAATLTAAARKQYRGRTDEATARNWLEHWEGDIVAAEASLKKKNTVNNAKLAIFTRLFGGGIPSIMNLLKCTREEASQFLREYGDAFPEMEPWIRKITSEGRRNGCVWTAFGRRIQVDPNFAYRGVNYIVQGSAADLIKGAMIRAEEYLRENNVQGWLVMTIHDELVFEFKKGVERMAHVRAIRQIMEDHGGAFGLPMPTACSVVDHRWVDTKEIKWANAA